ncbi:MAG: hypothetical protein AAGD13_24365 [Pseudomonadota bacterium]
MTTIITRLYEDEQTAHGVVQALRDHSFRDSMVDVITSSGDAQAAMSEAGVPEDAHDAYAQAIASGNALVAVRAPFGGAEKAYILMDKTPSVDMGGLAQTSYVAEDLALEYRSSSIIKGAPRLMSSPMFPSIRRGRSLLATMFGKPLMRKRLNIDNSIYRGTKYFANFPIPHLKKKKAKIDNAIYRGTKYFANFPIPHLVDLKRDPSLH